MSRKFPGGNENCFFVSRHSRAQSEEGAKKETARGVWKEGRAWPVTSMTFPRSDLRHFASGKKLRSSSNLCATPQFTFFLDKMRIINFLKTTYIGHKIVKIREDWLKNYNCMIEISQSLS